MTEAKPRPTGPEIASWILTGLALLLVLRLHLVSALLAGLLVFELVHILAPRLQRAIPVGRSRLIAVAILATLIIGAITAAILGTVAFFRSEAGSLPGLFQKLADIIESARASLPAWTLQYLPSDVDELRNTTTFWLREHAPALRLAGAEAGRAFAHILIGMIIGGVVSIREVAAPRNTKPLSGALTVRAERLGDAFRRVVFAQVRISALNTVFTAAYLMAVLPLFGVHLPFTKTLVALTFITGLLPVIGNLISNAVIVLVSLAHSPGTAVASLAFLVIIHKLEYFLNARIVGSHIHARAWELLVAMLAMEAAFGLPGVIVAPIYYAYLKQELIDRGLV